ncbi:hypothetical protein BX661DRAFT_176469 [Kickxella alabastrina]|uniref:uncharacterized protein n=1 Tax=Kickxella alabastrina TaxID=61397 RepID=UPI00221F8877|nr:uncharacterized protein BX661DRAFT_176469 [Kickxella alabastrina]KAI7834009.1 hypothetical protein BX661DRAFT_176469 [Kickxella alabastrina]
MLFKISTLALLVASVAGHMSIISPCPRYAAHGIDCPAVPAGESIDYSLSSPLGENEVLCKHTTPYATPSATWSAGQSVTVSFRDEPAAHSGGHCQFSLSYDGGNTFVVVHEELKYCFFGSAETSNNAKILSYTFNLPTQLPSSDNAVFAWSWVNASGNREFYMNCADVAIKGNAASYTGKQMTIANHAGYPTIGEFNGDYTTGLEHYTGASVITVTGSGAAADYSSAPIAPIAHNVVQPIVKVTAPVVVEPKVEVEAPVVVAPVVVTPVEVATSSIAEVQYLSVAPVVPIVYTTSVAQDVTTAPIQTTDPSSCTHGDMVCNGSGYTVCVWGVWTSLLNCAAGTTCRQTTPSVIYCDY